MTMKKVFICSPYRGDVERNVALAKAHARFAARCGYCPVVPWCGGSEILVDHRTKVTISVQCAKCRKIYKAYLDLLKTEKSKAQKRMG